MISIPFILSSRMFTSFLIRGLSTVLFILFYFLLSYDSPPPLRTAHQVFDECADPTNSCPIPRRGAVREIIMFPQVFSRSNSYCAYPSDLL